MNNPASSSHSHDYFSRKRDIRELLHSKDDDSGYIEGKVFMIWPPRNKLHRVNLEVVEDSALYRFEVEVPHKDGIAFRPNERISLALKGMKVIQRKESSAPHYFPIVIRYPDGVVYKYLNGTNAGKVVETWEGNTNEWYNPGIVHTVSNAVTIDASEIHHGPAPTVTYLAMPTPPRGDPASRPDEGANVDQLSSLSVALAGDAATVQSTRQVQQPSTEKPGRSLKARARKRRRLHKEKATTNQPENDANVPRPVNVPEPFHEQPQSSIQGSSMNASGGHPKLFQVSGRTNEKVSIQKDSEINLAREAGNTMVVPEAASVPALQLNAGIHTQRGDVFTALSDLRKGHSLVNVIGIVASANEERRTRNNEWCRSFALVDPSTIDSPRPSITVNCFQKKYSEWLPQVQKDDIVILRKLKAVEFNGSMAATGFGDTLRWAVYDPLEHSIRPPNKGSAPEKEITGEAMGYEFSPYWEPLQDSIELEYCRQIGEWWKATQELKGPNISIVQCSRARRQHLLISHASPDLPPNGFFDCTVEVLQRFNNHGGAATVYATDYTANALVHPVQARWCPPELSDRVLQISMWDNARNIALMMNPGEYWYLHNIRARWSPSHFMEGTMQLAEKVTQLDEANLEAQPQLKALLARKHEFELLNKSGLTPGSTSLHIFPEMFLQDVEGSTSFLTCIVELLHNDFNSRDGHFIYVTDYTYNPDLPATISTADWAHNLEHRVLKIKLDDAQAKISSALRSDSTFIIRNLRIKRSNPSGEMHGCLGGEDTLILPMLDSSSHHAQTLQRNREKWKRENTLDSLTTLSDMSRGEARGLLKQSPALFDNTTLIQEILARPAPGVFRVLARAVDFFPFSLEDACAVRCTKCNSSPPPSFIRCPRCDDMMDTYSRWFYRLYILLQDEEGSELIVSLSGKECTLLQDVDPADFRCDQLAFRRFLAKLDPILGNLRDVHVAWSKNEHKVIESPRMIFTIESWNVDEERGYGLLDCICTQGTGI